VAKLVEGKGGGARGAHRHVLEVAERPVELHGQQRLPTHLNRGNRGEREVRAEGSARGGRKG